MSRRVVLLSILFVIAAAARPLSAHENVRVIGILERHLDSTIAVKKNTGKTVSIKIDKQTEIRQNDKKVDATALKAGQDLVVDAYGDNEDDALAIVIRIVPPIRRGTR